MYLRASIHNLHVCGYVRLYIRSVRTFKSLVCTRVFQNIQNLQVSGYVLMRL